MTALLHDVVICCAACGKVLLRGRTYATIANAPVWFCDDSECVAERTEVKS